jgi:hypothetical protein
LPNIIVLGSGYSGSGAVFEYLIGRDDCLNPLNSSEARWVNDPGGVIDFLNRLEVHYPALVSDAFEDFLLMSREFEYHLPDHMKPHLSKLLEDIVLMDYQAMPLYKFNKMNKMQILAFRIYRKLGMRGKSSKVYFLKNREFVLRLFINFFEKFNQDSDKRGIIFNQAGSYWDPERSTECFGLRKIIRVNRDPRDIYADLKNKRSLFPTNNVEEFCKWFKKSQALIQPIKTDQCIDVKFENFVNDFDEEKKSLCRFLGIPNDVCSSYNVSESLLNVGKYKKILTKYESNFIEEMFSDFIL